MRSKFNGIRKFRNRIFYHEALSWNDAVIINYKKEMIEGIDWLENGLLKWSEDIFWFDEIMERRKELTQ